MKQPTTRALALAVMLAATGGMALAPVTQAAQAEKTDPEMQPSAVIATVNGKPITEMMFALYAQQRAARHPGTDPARDRDQILNELINMELVVQDAHKKNIEKRPDVEARIDWQKKNLLAGIDIQEYLMSHPVSEEALKKAYDEHVKNQPDTEYHARHILVKTRAEAESIIKQLEKGADFATLAKKDSTGPTGKRGGDLGWFSPDQMVKPFAEAVAKLKKGQYTKEPVHTQFGWHVIKLEDTRKVQPPSFEEVQPQLRAEMQGQQIEAFVAKLRKDAKIDVKQEAAPKATDQKK